MVVLPLTKQNRVAKLGEDLKPEGRGQRGINDHKYTLRDDPVSSQRPNEILESTAHRGSGLDRKG